jgi:predicted transcriptional regulator
MLALNLISNAIIPLKPTDTVKRANNIMADFKVNHLPLIGDDSQFLGLVCDDDLIEASDDSLINSISPIFINGFVYNWQHVYDVIRTVYEQKLSLIPVLDDNRNYLGIITLQTIMECIATLTSIKDTGGVIVLEINKRDNSLAHIAQIIEAQDAQILSSYTKYFPESTKIEVTLKVNLIDIKQILAALIRFNYTIKATFNHSKDDKGISDRYESLIKYLSI